MKKRLYFPPKIWTGENAIWSFLIALETDKVWGSIDKIDTNDFCKAIDQMRMYLTFGK